MIMDGAPIPVLHTVIGCSSNSPLNKRYSRFSATSSALFNKLAMRFARFGSPQTTTRGAT
ncbi:Uncharacterised protein [Vibrio cholerae]|nr:Uncharacterised protein [Vibrio cholerae]